jgi:hypothetical protein
MPAPAAHWAPPSSLQSWVKPFRRANTAAASSEPVTARRAPLDLGGLPERRTGAEQRLRRHARPGGAPTPDQLRLDQGGGQAPLDDPVGDVLPDRPGPMTTTS